MAQFTVNAHALRPVQELQVPREVGRPTTSPAISKVSALKRTTEVVKHREGGDPASTPQVAGPDRSTSAITLERGVTHDTEFEHWANKVWNFGAGPRRASVARRLPQGHHHRAVQRGRPAVHRATTSTAAGSRSTRPLPDLDANANAVAIQNIKLENEGWERDHGPHRAEGAGDRLHRPGRLRCVRYGALVALPGGCWLDGSCHREAVMHPLTGDDEAWLLETGGMFPAERSTALLARCMTKLGPSDAVTRDLARSLTVGDREALLLQLRRLTFGDELPCTVTCPAPTCAERLELPLHVSDLLLRPYPPQPRRTSGPGRQEAPRSRSPSTCPPARTRRPRRPWLRPVTQSRARTSCYAGAWNIWTRQALHRRPCRRTSSRYWTPPWPNWTRRPSCG